MMYLSSRCWMATLCLWSATSVGAFMPMAPIPSTRPSSETSLEMAKNYLEPGDPLMLVGPGFLQLVLAKHAKIAGLKPIIVAPQKKLDSFFTTLIPTEDELKADSTIGMPENGDPYFGELKGVVFCAEDAILPSDFVPRVLDFTHEGKSAFADGAPARVVCCLPVDDKVQKEKSNSWIPIFNNDRTIAQNWKNFYDKFTTHPVYKDADGVGSIVRFGSLFGGSYDGPDFLKDFGIDEGMYKMSLEQFRDLKERGFDRYRLGAQVLPGNSVNRKPPNQEQMEKTALKKFDNDIAEAFSIVGGYPEMDRVNRHIIAAGVIQSLMTPVGEPAPKEITILGKSVPEFPTKDEWMEMFKNPQPGKWPDPYLFEPSDYGIGVEQES